MKPLFTVHAGEFLVDCEIERKLRPVNVWIPAKDTGIDLLVSNNDNTTTVSLQVKFSRDYLVTHLKDAALHKELRAWGWWTPTRQQIRESRAQYWVFVLVGFANRSTDFMIIKPSDLLERLDAIHKAKKPSPKRFRTYLWVTKRGKCYESRNLNHSDQLSIADQTFMNDARDFSGYLNNRAPIAALNV
jgi:hypothetical protein